MERNRTLEFALQDTIDAQGIQFLEDILFVLQLEDQKPEIFQEMLMLLKKYEDNYYKYKTAHEHEKTMNTLYFKPI